MTSSFYEPYVPSFYFRAFAFLTYLQFFYLSLFLLGSLTFSRTLLAFIFLRALRCLIIYSQMPNKGGMGTVAITF